MNMASARCLVLNENWNPINVVTAHKAVKKVLNGRASFLDTTTCATYDFWGWVETWSDAIRAAKVAESNVVRFGSVQMKVPDVIVCTKYSGMGFKLDNARRPRFSRQNLFLRDRCKCQYCGIRLPPEELQLEHVIPSSKGGKTTWLNIVLACQDCNHKKANKTPAEAGMRLMRKPFEPTVEQLKIGPAERVKWKLGRHVPKTWEQFLGQVYWTAELTEDVSGTKK